MGVPADSKFAADEGMIDSEDAQTDDAHPIETSEPSALALAPIGVFDSGLGGLSVLHAIHCDLPYEDLIYFADSGHAPYGEKTDEFILERCLRIGGWMIDQGVKAIVVACNTATAAAVQALRAKYCIPIVGIEPGLKPATMETVTRKVGVLATASTLASERYAKLLGRIQAFAPNVEFISAQGVGWADQVEKGDIDSADTRALVRAVVEPLIAQGVDTLVLGCTHYPFLRHAIALAAPDAEIVDTAPAIAREIARRVRGESDPNPGPALGNMRIVTTGDIGRAQALAERMLALHCKVERSTI